MLTVERVREAFDYVPETGDLVYKASRRGCVKKGVVAGSVRKDAEGPGYRRFINLDGRKYRAHRLVWMWHGKELPERIDHIDRNPLNNRIENLRACDNAENGWNARLSKANKSGVRGVYWNKGNQKWRVRMMVRGKILDLGCHEDFDLAELIASEARAKYHGPFAVPY